MSGAETWQMRGIIPRALTFLFDELEKRTDLGNYYNKSLWSNNIIYGDL
jgi:hypothetical protein